MQQSLTDLSQAIKNVNDAEHLKTKSEAITIRLEQVQLMETDLSELLNQWSLYKEHGVLEEHDVESLRSHFVAVETIFPDTIEKFKAPNVDKNHPELDGQFKYRIDALTRKLVETLADSWRRYRQRVVTGLNFDKGLINAFSKIQLFKSDMEGILQLSVELHHQLESKALTHEHFTRLDNSVEELKGKLEDTFSHNIPISAQEFVRGCTMGGGAPYSSLTEDVIRWLSDVGLLDNVRIQISGFVQES